jgi:hypothetical protein
MLSSVVRRLSSVVLPATRYPLYADLSRRSFNEAGFPFTFATRHGVALRRSRVMLLFLAAVI